ncbi:hypothetical protein [Nocardioides ultimimeridianus]
MPELPGTRHFLGDTVKTHARLAAAFSVAALVSAAAAGCGSQDDTSNATDPASVASSTPTLSAQQTAACAALLKVPVLIPQMGHGDGPPSPKVLAKVETAMKTIAGGTTGRARAAATSVASTIDEATSTKNFKLLEADDFQASLLAPGVAGVTTCGFPETDARIVEMAPMKKGDTPMFHYRGVPATMTAGTHSIKITSQSGNFHEMTFVRVKDATTRPKDLLDLPDKQFAKVAAGAPFLTLVAPKGTSYLNVDLKPGRYIVFCHVPLMDKKGNLIMGSRGPIWHFDLGMATALTVS